jgi:hypothetical protein
MDIVFRADDSVDNSCGDECDPQMCNDDSPPVCTPYPSNINDAFCNVSFGGDPNDPLCLNGDRKGLVCILTAVASWNGSPTGSFVIPDVQATGPTFAINLSKDAGTPGIIIPGLGGEEPDFPLSIPRFAYECPPFGNGEVTVELFCSDGDLECAQRQELTVSCLSGNWCGTQPRDCSGSTPCFTDGVCDPGCPLACDPDLPSYDPGSCELQTGVAGGTCDSCPGQDIPLPVGTHCGSGGASICDGLGACVDGACSTDADCSVKLFTPECMEGPTCVDGACELSETPKPPGTACSEGVCNDRGDCVEDKSCESDADCEHPEVCNRCVGLCGTEFDLISWASSGRLSLACTSSLLEEPFLVFWDLTVQFDSGCGYVSGGTGIWDFGAIVELPEHFLDALQDRLDDGVSEIELLDTRATVRVRSGGTGADQTLMPSGIVLPQIVALPTTEDCGICASIDDGSGAKTAQCANNGFCVTGAMPIRLDGKGEYTSAESGEILFGFDDTSTGATINPDGTYDLPDADAMAASGPSSLRFRAGDEDIAIECTMAVDSDGPYGIGFPGGFSPTPSSQLVGFTIAVP